MEFKSLKNIETSFRQIRLFGIIYTAACASWWSARWCAPSASPRRNGRRYTSSMEQESYARALAGPVAEPPAEAREHVRRFHELFFTLSPEKSAIEHNVKRALLLADKSAYNYYADFAEKASTTASSPGTSTKCCRWTAWCAISTAIPTRRGHTPVR